MKYSHLKTSICCNHFHIRASTDWNCADFELLATFLTSFGHIFILEDFQNAIYKVVSSINYVTGHIKYILRREERRVVNTTNYIGMAYVL